MESKSLWCAECGRNRSDEYYNPILPCPDCGSTKTYGINRNEVKLKISGANSNKGTDASGFVIQEHKERRDVSEKTKRPVLITKDTNRTNPEVTTFHHKVEELDEHKIFYKTTHEHTDQFPAKHRPKKGKDLK